tara:strand:+ start:1717 stop:2028 length:312 start_codon:yes stop_codon:yes gene_type:complete
MCGGGGRPKDRTDEMLAVQREQMAEQKRQYEETRADNVARQEEQKKIAQAPSAPPPSATAGSAAAALEIPGGDLGLGAAEKRRGYGRRRLRTDLKKGSGLQIP